MTITSRFFAFTAALVAASASTVLATSPAQAETRSVLVPTAGIDLRSDAGMAIMRGRINRAARQVCGQYDGRNLVAVGSFRGCHSEAIAGANAQLAQVTVLASAQPIAVAAASR